MEAVVISFVLFIVGLVIFYNIIEIAVRNGINSSIIGKFLESKNEIIEDEKSFLGDELDNDR